MKEKKKQPWVRKRHKVITALLRPLIGTYTKWKYGVKVEPFREENGRQYLVMMNHQTAYDQFFIAKSFRGPVYYIATEDIFSIGWISGVIRYLVAPIPIRKQTTDLQAVKNCIQVAREGGTIALAPEGNRTYSGKTEYIKPSIVKLARALKLPIAIYRIEGGYGVQPRWAGALRKGTMRSYVSRVVEPEEYKALTDDELYDLLCEELYVNEGTPGGIYRSKHLAEYLERAVYVCPFCGLSVFESHGDQISCKTCGRTVRYLPTKELVGEGFDFPFRFVNDWYDYQSDYVNRVNPEDYCDEPAYRDTAGLSEVLLYRRKQRLRKEAAVALYGNRIVIDEQVYDFDTVSAVTVLGKNKLNIYYDGHVYQLKGDKRFNALKYVNFYYHYKNISEGKYDVKFLGL